MIDIHSHTLWHLDDGSPDFETTMRMCGLAESGGTETLFVTPHIVYWKSADELYDRRERKIEQLCDELIENDSKLKIERGFELLCDDEIFNIKYFKPYTLAGSRYILIEFDFYKTDEEDVKIWCDYLKSFGLVPVIAHPERYEFALNDISSLDRISEEGVLFQINAGSPVGIFGDAECGVALKMLKCGYVDFIGSDAHNDRTRNTDMSSFFRHYPDFVSDELIERCVNENPLKIIADEPIKTRKTSLLKDW